MKPSVTSVSVCTGVLFTFAGTWTFLTHLVRPESFTPTWGGATAREGLGLLQGLAGLNVVATDINTLSPLYDVGGMSAFLAATCVLECIGVVAAARGKRA